jgi:serine/threonine protein kinase
MSPERLTGDKYGRDSDLWSVGVMMAECLLGEHPIK